MPSFGKVAVVAVVGNEDGAHHCHAAIFQALNDVGFTIPAGAGAYWVGEAMGSTNYVDLSRSRAGAADPRHAGVQRRPPRPPPEGRRYPGGKALDPPPDTGSARVRIGLRSRHQDQGPRV